MLQDIKVNNIMKILRTIKNYGEITIDDLASVIDIPRSTVYRLMNHLILKGVLIGCPKANAGMGRTPQVFKLNGGYTTILGINFDKYYIQVSLSDMSNCVIVKWTSMLNETCSKAQILEIIDRGIEAVAGSLLPNAAQSGNPIAISVAVTAAISADGESILVFNQRECMNDFNIVKYLEDKYRIHTILTKASTLRTIAYLNEFGRRSISNYVYAYIGTGIGAGIVIDGKLLRGNKGGAGEFARTPMYGTGETFEEVYSQKNLYRKIENYLEQSDDRELKRKLKLLDQLELERNQRMMYVAEYCLQYGGEEIRKTVRETCWEWGKLCGLISALYDPQMLIIGGEVSASTPNIYECIRESFLASNAMGVDVMPAKAFYSWDELIAMNASDYIIDTISGEFAGKN